MSNSGEIIAGSIVEVNDESYSVFHGYQGYVVCPYSEIYKEDGCTVAVFFGKEVEPNRFNSTPEVESWDAENREMLYDGDFSPLLIDDKWRHCPRVVYLNPGDLKISKHWSIQTLSKRFYGDDPHHLHDFGRISEDPSLYLCFIENCDSPATRMTVYNVWGLVIPIHLCGSCFIKYNGIRTDGVPHRERILLVDGSEFK
jgi:hypothetical protein